MEQTARPLGGSKPNANYGYGLINAAAATAATPGTVQARRQAATRARFATRAHAKHRKPK
jgi:hypothetical protein